MAALCDCGHAWGAHSIRVPHRCGEAGCGCDAFTSAEPQGSCVVCLAPCVGSLFCSVCKSSYDRARDEADGSVADVIRWAARRARRFARSAPRS